MNFSNLNSSSLIGLSSSLAIYIGDFLSAEELAIASSFFTAFADNLAIIATTKATNDSLN